jgi:hypothetical protein
VTTREILIELIRILADSTSVSRRLIIQTHDLTDEQLADVVLKMAKRRVDQVRTLTDTLLGLDAEDD